MGAILQTHDKVTKCRFYVGHPCIALSLLLVFQVRIQVDYSTLGFCVLFVFSAAGDVVDYGPQGGDVVMSKTCVIYERQLSCR